MNREILQLAIPSIITNISVPLLGLVDTYIAGHLSPYTLASISIGTAIISSLYWAFGFIRMSTSGIAAQAYGKKDAKEMANSLSRSLLFSFIAILLIFLIKDELCELALKKIDNDLKEQVVDYIDICIWGAVPVLSLYAFKGWFIGLQNTIYPMLTSILMNMTNILLNFFFVYKLDMDIKGIALATVIAQYFALVVCIGLAFYKYHHLVKELDWKETIKAEGLTRTLNITSALFFRSLFLIAVTNFIPIAGAKEGVSIVAGNATLMLCFTLFSYFTDGFAYAGEAISGKYVGAQDYIHLKKAVRHLFIWGSSIALCFTFIYAVGAETLLSNFIKEKETITSSLPYIKWVVAIPLVGFAAFLWDGIMIGITKTIPMLIGTLAGAVVFFAIYYSCIAEWHNHAIWCAFLSYLATRSLVQTIWWQQNNNKIIKTEEGTCEA